MDKVVLHGRFAPDGVVVEMGERPEPLTPQQWFNYLSDKAADAYRTLAGARIVFTLPRERLDALKRDATA
jgi:hypothetical protein